MKFKDFISENHFKKGQKVKVANAKSYDSLAKSSEVHGEIAGQSMMVKGVEYYPVKVGTGSYNVESKDLMLNESRNAKKVKDMLFKFEKFFHNKSDFYNEVTEMMGDDIDEEFDQILEYIQEIHMILNDLGV